MLVLKGRYMLETGTYYLQIKQNVFVLHAVSPISIIYRPFEYSS